MLHPSRHTASSKDACFCVRRVVSESSRKYRSFSVGLACAAAVSQRKASTKPWLLVGGVSLSVLLCGGVLWGRAFSEGCLYKAAGPSRGTLVGLSRLRGGGSECWGFRLGHVISYHVGMENTYMTTVLLRERRGAAISISLWRVIVGLQACRLEVPFPQHSPLWPKLFLGTGLLLLREMLWFLLVYRR